MNGRPDYKILLEGVEACDLPVSVLRDLCDLLIEGSQRAARLAVEGRSVARGTLPAWIASAADLRVAKYEQGSLDLSVSAPSLHAAAPELFAQQQIFSTLASGDTTALDLLLNAADDAVAGRRDSDRLDAGVLEVLANAGSLFARGSTRLSVSRVGCPPVVIDPSAAQSIRLLADETPASRVSRVRGTLDALTVSTRTFVLKLEGGRALRGLAGSVSIDTLKALLGSEVTVEGVVAFRPSGDALRIEVDHAALAQPADLLWARLPHVDVGQPRLAAGIAPDLEKIFGRWPGEESEDDVFNALANLS